MIIREEKSGMGLESIDFSNILFSGNDCCRPLMRFNLLLQKPCDCSDFSLKNFYEDMFQYNMGRDARKPVFGVSDKARLKPVSSATETS